MGNSDAAPQEDGDPEVDYVSIRSVGSERSCGVPHSMAFVSDSMIQAGVQAYRQCVHGEDADADVVREVFLAMCHYQFEHSELRS